MPRTIPAGLQGHLNGEVHSLAFLLKVTAQNGTSFGVTSHDQSIVFDDGAGPLTYSTIIGLTQSPVKAGSTLEVPNAESTLLIADSGVFTEQEIEAGVLDFARFVVYRVNFRDLTQGHFIFQAGTTGAVRNSDGLAGVIELRGIAQELRQTFVELYSISCRATFGSQPGQSAFFCGFDAESLWGANKTVTAVWAEPDRIFTGDVAPAASGPFGPLPFVPALVQFLTGANAGAYSETEIVTDATIYLRFPLPYDIKVGDLFRIRPDCAKRFHQDCIGHYNNVLNFRGEPLIPVVGRD